MNMESLNSTLMSCLTYNNIGTIHRIIITAITYCLIYKYGFCAKKEKILDNPKGKWCLPIFAIILIILDSLDCNWKLGFYKRKECSKTFYYQIIDKINDSLSYLVAWKLFGLDSLFLYLTLYRCIGVVLFGVFRNATYLILFPDINKEYLVYLFLFGYNFKYIWLLVLGKMAYEYYHHTYINKRIY